MGEKQKISEDQLQGFQLLKSFRKVLKRVSKGHTAHPSWKDPRRKLQEPEYLSTYLFALVNPALESMRAVCEATKCDKVQQCACSNECSPSSFSEMQHLIDLALLEDVFNDLAQQLQQRQGSDGKKVNWRINDSSVFDVLKRMDWAYFQTHKGQPQCAVRMHVSLDLVCLAPVSVGIDKAKMCERKLWK